MDIYNSRNSYYNNNNNKNNITIYGTANST